MHEGERRGGVRRVCPGWSESGMGGGREKEWRVLSGVVIKIWEYREVSDNFRPSCFFSR